MTIMSDKKRILNQIKIDQSTLSRLIELANIQGVPLGELAGQMLDVGTLKWKEPKQSDTEEYVSWWYHKARTKSKMINQIMWVAAEYAENGTEQSADHLEKMCEAAGLSTARVLERVQGDPLQLAIAEGSAKTEKGRIMQWLPRFLLEQNGRADYQVIMTAARKMGWAEKDVKAARDALNISATSQVIENNRIVRIDSVKEGKGWTWIYIIRELGGSEDE